MNTICFFDLDGTLIHVGDRFTNNPLPQELEKNRKDSLYKEWLAKIQTPELLAKDIPVRGTQHLVEAFENSVYLTSRSELYKNETLKWLAIHNYPPRHLIMRSENDTTGYAEFKEIAITHHLNVIADQNNSFPEAYNVIVFDDDNKGELEKMCKRRGYTFFKALSGGEVI